MPSHTFLLSLVDAKCSPYPESVSTLGLASFAFARHYSQNLGWFLFLALLRCFSSGGSPRIPMYSVYDAWGFSCGLLHSEICGSKCTYHSPQLIAVNHVLHRLPIPRHSPCALISFTICFMFYEFSLKLLISQYIVVFYPIILSYRFKLVVSSFALLFSLFCFQASFSVPKNRFQQSTSIDHSNPFLGFGGHKWTRTIDLTLIRRVL